MQVTEPTRLRSTLALRLRALAQADPCRVTAQLTTGPSPNRNLDTVPMLFA